MKITALVFVAFLAPVNAGFGYLDQMAGGGTATVKPSSYAPGGKKSFTRSGGSGMGNYLDSVAPPVTVRAPPPPPIPQPSVSSFSNDVAAVAAGDYLASLKVGAPVAGGGLTGYLDAVGGRSSPPSGVGLSGYLDAVGGGGSPPTGSGVRSYLDVVSGGAGSAAKPASYGIYGASKGAFTPAAASAASSITTSGSNDVLDAIARMNNNMNTNQHATISVLKDISAGVKTLVSKAEARRGSPSGSWQ